MLILDNLGKKLKLYRNLRGVKLEDMEEKIGLSLSTLMRIEANAESISLFNLGLICTYLSIDISCLINSCLDEEYVLIRDKLKELELKIRRYDFDINQDLLQLSEISKQSSFKKYLNFSPILEYYYYLNEFENGDIYIVHKDLKYNINNKDLSFLNDSFFTYVTEDRYKILYANTCASIGDVQSAIKIERELLLNSLTPITLVKVRMNLAKHYYANKDYKTAYQYTLDTIKYLYRHSITDKLQGAFWMKGICEYKLNLEFSKSLEMAVHSAFYSGLINQGNIFKDYSKNRFGLIIEVPSCKI